MTVEVLAPNFMEKSLCNVVEACSLAKDCYEIIREEIVRTLQEKVSPAQKILIDRISRCVATIFVAFCTVSGSWAVLGSLVFTAQVGWVLYECLRDVFKQGVTNEAILQAWMRVKKESRAFVENKIAPALLVAFAVDALFCCVIGISMQSLRHLLRSGLLSAPTTYVLYDWLVRNNEIVVADIHRA